MKVPHRHWDGRRWYLHICSNAQVRWKTKRVWGFRKKI